MKKILILLLLISANASAQNQELVESVTKNSYEGKSYIYTKDVRLQPPAGGGSYLVSAAQHGTFFIRPAEAARIPQKIPVSLDKNFARTEKILVENISNEDQICYLTPSQIWISYLYSDALGRPWQSVSQQNSPLGYDMVKYFSYDASGRSPNNFLPYVSANTNGSFNTDYVTDQANFYGPSSSVASDTRPFSENIYENSPLNRISKTFSPGNDWYANNRGVASNSKIDVSGGVLFWKYDEGIDLPVLEVYNNSSGYCPAGYLIYTETVDEENTISRNYSDPSGRGVLHENQNIDGSWLRTYSVYDDVGRLRIVFPPEAAASISQYTALATNAERQDFLDQWTYQYVYDEFGRVSKSKVPGSGWIYFVFDKWDRLVLSQDAKQRSSNQWIFNKYDRFNRIAVSGIYTTATVHSALQSNALNMGDANRFENEVGSGIGYTLNNSFPTAGISEGNVDVVNHYDNYSFMFSEWDSPQNNDFSFQNVSGYPQSSEKLSIVKGYPTGSRIKVLGDSKWLNTVIYYDGNYNPIQVIDESDLGGVIRTTKKFDFVGRVERVHSYNTYASLNEEYFYMYDHAGRVLKTEHSINGAAPIVMVSNRFNEIGQQVEKNIHSTIGNNSLQSVDYQYNIRGLMTSMNNSSLSPQAGDPQNDLFGLELQYNPPALSSINGVFTTKKYYDGNISSVKWKTNTLQNGVTPVERIYGFDYDIVSRFKYAYYATNNGGTWNGDGGMFDEEITGYDRQGNINGLKRYNRVQGAKTLIDNLTYDYVLSGKKSDRLINMEDASGHSLGFKPAVASVSEEYQYDANGNLRFDHNKSISEITYNYLNLPNMIEFTRSTGQIDRIYYTYDATGKKLSRRITINGSDVWTTNYSQNFQYDNDKLHDVARLSFFSTREGRVVNNGTGYDYEYFLKDYLGNTRVGFGFLKETLSYRATVEPGMATSEVNDQGFRNLNETRSPIPSVNYTPRSDQTPSPDRSAKCNGLAGTAIGPAKYIRVLQGDAVYMEVFARYDQTGSNTNNILSTALVSALTSATSFNIPNGGETSTLWSGFNTNATAVLDDQTESTTIPKAYLVWLYFDDAHNFIRFGADPITDQAHEKFEKLSRSFTATTNGHLYVYVANENNQSGVDVYFDELYIVHQKNNSSLQVTQASDYYPFGLSFNQYHSDKLYNVSTDTGSPQNNVYSSTLRNRYLMQAQEFQKDLDLNWYQFDARMYEPATGRFVSVDPLADKYSSASVYNFTLNNPLAFVDPDGRGAVYAWPGAYSGWDPFRTSRAMADRAGAQYSDRLAIEAQVSMYAKGNLMGSQAHSLWFRGASPETLRSALGNNVPTDVKIPRFGNSGSGHDSNTSAEYLNIAAQTASYLPMAENMSRMFTSVLKGDAVGVGIYGGLALAEGAMELGGEALIFKFLSKVGGTSTVAQRLAGHLEYAVKNYTLTDRQLAAGLKYPNLMKAYTGTSIDRLFKARVNADEFLMGNNLSTTGLFIPGPDVFRTPIGTGWFDVTTPTQWNAHVNLYTAQYGPGSPLFYNFFPNTSVPYFMKPF